jgi:hypothetical protein
MLEARAGVGILRRANGLLPNGLLPNGLLPNGLLQGATRSRFKAFQGFPQQRGRTFYQPLNELPPERRAPPAWGAGGAGNALLKTGAVFGRSPEP